AAAFATWRRRGHAAHLHPGRRRLHQRAAPGNAEAVHDRERHPVEVLQPPRLPRGGGSLVHPDGGGAAFDRPLCARRRHGEADRMKFIRRHVLTAYAILAFAYLLVPIAIVVLFSFNDPAGRYNYTWQGFTLDQWRNWDGVPGLREAMTL